MTPEEEQEAAAKKYAAEATEATKAVLELLEPTIARLAPLVVAEAKHLIPLLSLAISLRRIADQLEGSDTRYGAVDAMFEIARRAGIKDGEPAE